MGPWGEARRPLNITVRCSSIDHQCNPACHSAQKPCWSHSSAIHNAVFLSAYRHNEVPFAEASFVRNPVICLCALDQPCSLVTAAGCHTFSRTFFLFHDILQYFASRLVVRPIPPGIHPKGLPVVVVLPHPLLAIVIVLGRFSDAACFQNYAALNRQEPNEEFPNLILLDHRVLLAQNILCKRFFRHRKNCLLPNWV